MIFVTDRINYIISAYHVAYYGLNIVKCYQDSMKIYQNHSLGCFMAAPPFSNLLKPLAELNHLYIIKAKANKSRFQGPPLFNSFSFFYKAK